MIPYMDPKMFGSSRSYQLNKESDVYSVGILLWEISSGRPPFEDKQHDVSLAMKILQGQREEIIPDTPKDYVKIYTGKFYYLNLNYNRIFLVVKNLPLIYIYCFLDCWDNEPVNRPTMDQVVDKLKKITGKDQTGHYESNHQLS